MGRLRTDNGWNQDHYARRAGHPPHPVSDTEGGARNPTITVVEKLARLLGVSAGDLLDGGCSQRGDIVLGCFGGSGSTLVAAHKTGRTAPDRI